jgi:endonuclease YncB( thermonuclease family)
MIGRLIAILAFRRRTECLTGRAKVIDGDTIVVPDQLVRLHGIDAPELDQTFWWRGEQIACGTMSLAALEALIAGVKVRCEVIERDRHGRLVAKVYSPNGVDVGRRLVSAGWALAYHGTRRTTSTPRTRPARPSAGFGGEPSSNPGCGVHRHRHALRRNPFSLRAARGEVVR